MREDVVTLIGNTGTTSDEIGNQIASPRRTEVFALVASAGKNEHYSAAQMHLKAEFKLVIRSFEYNGEKIVELDGKQYSVYRVYEKGDDMELYLSEKIGGYDGQRA